MLFVYLIYGLSGALGGIISSCFSYTAHYFEHLESEGAGPVPNNENAPLLQQNRPPQQVRRGRYHYFHQLIRISILQSCSNLGSAAGYFLVGYIMQRRRFFHIFHYLFSLNVVNLIYVLMAIPTIRPSPPPPHEGLPANLNVPPAAPKCPSFQWILLPFKLVWASVKATFIEPTHNLIDCFKVIIALLILWFYIFSDRIQTALDYKYLLLPPSNFSNRISALSKLKVK